jgi:Flp pilus assembly protein TadD
VEAAYYRGQLSLDQERYREAIADFDRVEKEKKGFRALYLLRARAHLAQKEETAGIADLNRYLELTGAGLFDPEAAEAFAKRGRLLRLLVPRLPKAARPGALQLAVRELQKADTLELRSAALFDDLGAVLEQLPRRKKEALGAYSRGLELEPKNVKLLTKRGWLYVDPRLPPQYDEAEADFKEALGVEPKNAEAHAGLGYVRACRKARDEAHWEADLALLYGAGDYLTLHNIACIYGELSRSDDGRVSEHQDLALTVLQRATELWSRDRAGPNEIELIKDEVAFPKPLRERPEFQKLLDPNSTP